jgi:hypothetical protein
MAKWSNYNVNNGFDDPYKICYTKENKGAILKLENAYGGVAFYIQESYFCDEEPVIDMSFLVNNQWKKYSFIGEKNEKGNTIFFTGNIKDTEIFGDFLTASFVKVRVNETYCDTKVYQFSMTGSASAYNFIK